MLTDRFIMLACLLACFLPKVFRYVCIYGCIALMRINIIINKGKKKSVNVLLSLYLL